MQMIGGRKWAHLPSFNLIQSKRFQLIRYLCAISTFLSLSLSLSLSIYLSFHLSVCSISFFLSIGRPSIGNIRIWRHRSGQFRIIEMFPIQARPNSEYKYTYLWMRRIYKYVYGCHKISIPTPASLASLFQFAWTAWPIAIVRQIAIIIADNCSWLVSIVPIRVFAIEPVWMNQSYFTPADFYDSSFQFRFNSRSTVPFRLNVLGTFFSIFSFDFFLVDLLIGFIL